MRQCDVERVEFPKGGKIANRTGDKLTSFIDGVTPDMKGAIIEIKKLKGLWVVDAVHDQEIETHQIKRNWHVGGL